MKKLATILCVAILAAFTQCGPPREKTREKADASGNPRTWNDDITDNANDMLEKGKAVFRYETFGDEAFWTDKLQLHKAIAHKDAGGTGEGLTPKAALDAGLKVDLDILPEAVKREIEQGDFLNDT